MKLPRMRITFVSYYFGRQFGGAEAYGVELMKELSKDHDIQVLTQQADPKLSEPFTIKKTQIPSYWPSWIRAYLFAKQVATLIQSEPADIVHSHVNGWAGDVDVLHVKSVRYHKITKAKSWLSRRLCYLSPRLAMYLWLEKQRVHLTPPKRTVVVSELLKKQLQEAYNTNYPFDTITPGVHLPTLDVALRTKQRQQLGYNEQDLVCIQVARNPLAKGLPTLLQALTDLPSHIKLLVVGAPQSLASQLAPQLNKLQLHERVQFVEQQACIDAYYQAADLCVHPTLNDSFGMAPLEAMSYKLPVIMSAAKWCGFAHYAQDQQQALLLKDPTNPAEICTAITQLIDSPSTKERLQENGYELATQFSWPAIAKRYEAIYVEVFAGRLHNRKLVSAS